MEAIAARLFRQATGRTTKSVTRFPVGLCHYVYHVTTADDADFVLRLATAGNREIFKGGRYWLGQLESLALPIPRVVHDGSDDDRPFLILNYLPGADLGTVYTTLTEPQKQRIAAAVCAIQQQVATLPHHRGYGHLRSWAATDCETSWQAVVERHIARSLAGIRHHRIFMPAAPWLYTASRRRQHSPLTYVRMANRIMSKVMKQVLSTVLLYLASGIVCAAAPEVLFIATGLLLPYLLVSLAVSLLLLLFGSIRIKPGDLLFAFGFAIAVSIPVLFLCILINAPSIPVLFQGTIFIVCSASLVAGCLLSRRFFNPRPGPKKETPS